MTTISWTGAAGDHLFTTAANWSTDTVPGAGDDVSIGNGIGVQDTAPTTVNSIVLGTGTTLEISSPFTATNGTGAATSSGTFYVDNGQSFSIGGTFNDTGLVSLNSSGSTTTLALLGSTTLQGGGTIVLGASGNKVSASAIGYAGATSMTLTNNDDTISGAGSISATGAGQLTIVNNASGVINANTPIAGALTITANGGLTNMGLIEGNIDISNTTVTNTGGTIGATLITNSTVNNVGGTINAATIATSTIVGGTITGATVNIQGGILSGGSPGNQLTVTKGTGLNAYNETFEGDIDNLGSISGGDLPNEPLFFSGPTILNGAGSTISYTITGVNGPATDILTNNSTLHFYETPSTNFVNQGVINNMTVVNSGTIIGGFSLNNSTFTNNSGAAILLEFTNDFYAITGEAILGGSTLINNGAIQILGTTDTISTAVTGSGTLFVQNATKGIMGNFGYPYQNSNGVANLTGNFQNNIVFESSAGFTGGQEVKFAQAYSGVISGFALNDLIDVTSIAYAVLNHLVWQPIGPRNGVLVLENVADATLASFNLFGVYNIQDFSMSNDGNGNTLITETAAVQPPPAKVVASADNLFATGMSTALWQSSSGAAAGWTFSNTYSVSQGFYLPTLNATSNIIGAGDFNGDGYDDILVQDSVTGALTQWFMNGASVTSQNTLPDPGSSWIAKALGDFNGDGLADIAFQNVDGSIAVWDMNGGAIQAAAVVANPGTSWHLDATGDFDGNGGSELLFQNDDGSVATWEMNGASLVSGADLPNPDPTWHVKGTGDFNSDGKSDILFQNNDGSVAIWEMSNSSTLLAAAIIGNPGSNWQVGGIGDYTGSGMSDILLQNSATGAVNVWIMNGLTLSQQVSLSTNPGTSWHPVV